MTAIREMVEDMVDEMLDADGQVITVAGITYVPSQILKEMDPIAYNEEFNHYLDDIGVDLYCDEV